jgi:hypothetical protein
MSGHTARARSDSTRSHSFVRMTLAIDFPFVNCRRPLRWGGQPISDWGAQTWESQNYVLANTGNCGEGQDLIGVHGSYAVPRHRGTRPMRAKADTRW